MSAAQPPRLDFVSDADRASRADWEAAAAGVLRKARSLAADARDTDVWDALAFDSLAGVSIPPLGYRELVSEVDPGHPGVPPFTRGRRPRPAAEGWDLRVEVLGPDANAAALHELDQGATSVWLTELGRSHHSGEPDDLPHLLAGVMIDLAPVILDAPRDPVAAATAYAALVAERGVTLAAGTNLGADPISARLRGVAEANLGDAVAVAEIARSLGCRALVVDTTAIHDLGASEWLELGYGLALGSTYLRLLIEAGFDIDEAMGLIEFRYAATADQFVTIAKLRAGRTLWNRMGEVCGAGASSRGQVQHAVTSRPMMTRYDPWVNMLRTTVAAFAAAVGGADAITVLPFDEALGLPDDFSRRIARNTSSLLIAESQVGRVLDPGGGSYALERLTQDLAEAGWRSLQDIDAEGGIVEAVRNGFLEGLVADARGARETRVARRREPITGVSEFPNPAEVPLERQPRARGVERYAAPFEELRDLPPSAPAFLATLGSTASHTPRAMFATNLLAAGGVPVAPSGPCETSDELVAAYAGQPVVVLAGADAAYDTWGTQAVTALRAAGARWVIGMGKAADLGCDETFARGADAVAFLARTREQLA